MLACHSRATGTSSPQGQLIMKTSENKSKFSYNEKAEGNMFTSLQMGSIL